MKKIPTLIFIVYLLFVFITESSGQNPKELKVKTGNEPQKASNEKIESLIKKLRTANEDINKVKILNELSVQYVEINLDTAISLANRAITLAQTLKDEKGLAYGYYNLACGLTCYSKEDEAKQILEKVIQIAERINDNKLIVDSYNEFGILYSKINKFPEALEQHFKALKLCESYNDEKGIATTWKIIGHVYKWTSNYQKAYESYQKSLIIFEKLNDKSEIANILGNIGKVHRVEGNNIKALEYHLKQYNIVKQSDDKKSVFDCLLDLGQDYINLSDYQKALDNFFDALTIAENYGVQNWMALCYLNIGYIYMDKGDYVKAKIYYLKTLEIDKVTNDKQTIINDFQNIANLLYIQGNYKEALSYLFKAEKLGFEINALFPLMRNYKMFSDIYFKTGQYKQAYEYLDKYYTQKDSVFNIEKSQKISSQEIRYLTEIKEKQIENQNLELKTKKNLVWLLVTISAAILSILVVIILLYRNKHKTNILLAEKNKLISESNIELEYLNQDLALKNYQISEQNANILASINYAKKIQQAILPLESRIAQKIKDFFILYKPRDIVSGDFFWYSEIEDTVIFAVLDCTGHGVPGAFMSMIGNDLLHYIVDQKEIIMPSQILEELDKGVRYALKQDEAFSQDDGMDACIISIKDINTKPVVTFSGAKRPLYNINLEKNFKEFNEIKGDNRSIGGRLIKRRDFTDKIIEINKDTILYLTTDGFSDLHSVYNEKFGLTRFQNFLNEISGKALTEQKILLDKELENFTMGEKIMDDITVVGIKLSSFYHP